MIVSKTINITVYFYSLSKHTLVILRHILNNSLDIYGMPATANDNGKFAQEKTLSSHIFGEK